MLYVEPENEVPVRLVGFDSYLDFDSENFVDLHELDVGLDGHQRFELVVDAVHYYEKKQNAQEPMDVVEHYEKRQGNVERPNDCLELNVVTEIWNE